MLRIVLLVCCGTALGMALSDVAVGQPIIDVGSHQLAPNQADQQLEISVTGGASVEAMNFNAQIEDGGSAGDAVDVGPRFVDVDLLTGTIFEDNNFGQFGTEVFPNLVIASTITGSGAVEAEGLLATLTVDTIGVAPGTYMLSLSNTLNGATDFADVTPTLHDGVLHVVPEPSSLAVLSVAAFLLLGRRSPLTPHRQ